MRALVPTLVLLPALALAVPGPDAGPSARASATPTVRTLGAGAVVDRIEDGVVLGHRGEAPLAWAWRGGSLVSVPPPASAPPVAVPSAAPVTCTSGTPTPVSGTLEGWSAGLCPDGRVVIARGDGGQGVQATIAATDGVPVVGARLVDPGQGALAVVAWGASGQVRVTAWRAAELAPVLWREAWMPAGPPLDWPVPTGTRDGLTAAVTLDLTLPTGASVVDAAIVDGRLWVAGTLPMGKQAAAVVFDTEWIPVLPR